MQCKEKSHILQDASVTQLRTVFPFPFKRVFVYSFINNLGPYFVAFLRGRRWSEARALCVCACVLRPDGVSAECRAE